MLVNFAAITRPQNSLDMWFFDFWYRHVRIFLTRCSARISRITAWTIYFLQWRSGKARVRVDRGVQAKFEAGWHRPLIGPSKKSDAVCMSIGDQHYTAALVQIDRRMDCWPGAGGSAAAGFSSGSPLAALAFLSFLIAAAYSIVCASLDERTLRDEQGAADQLADN